MVYKELPSTSFEQAIDSQSQNKIACIEFKRVSTGSRPLEELHISVVATGLYGQPDLPNSVSFCVQELWTWTKLCSCAGSIMFAVSDSLIGFHHFVYHIPYSQVSGTLFSLL